MDHTNLLKEIEFVESHMNTEMRAAKVEEARLMNLLYNCEYCHKNEFLPSEVCCCPKAHSFCLQCIQKIVERKVDLKQLEFKCCKTGCTEHLNLDMIMNVVDAKLLKRLVRLMQAEGIDTRNE